MQYTIRQVPRPVDRLMRARARREGKSLNQVAIEALSRGIGAQDEGVSHRSLRDVAGTWKRDPEVEKALEDQRRIDPALWR